MLNETRPPFMVERNPGYFEYWLPVSVKMVVDHDGKVPLLMNEREEWELPGGKLDQGETPEGCVRREVREELNLTVDAQDIVSSWVYEITPVRHVFLVAYGGVYSGSEAIRYSHEHKKLGVFGYDEVPALNMPDPYKAAIRKWGERLNRY
ncbi:NUDIX hydrolase [Nocardiopsis quinghaiensis]|uniref:NUDIX hydrolase n=1 Tax=Nocardiopsis quinghaiensis TaxID=464995 RepID=UPI001CC248E8|nr:NUDIX hydrolase [Nocardiopsis quinghaiensis]